MSSAVCNIYNIADIFVAASPQLGGRSSSLVPQLDSSRPSVTSIIQPSVNSLCPIQDFVHGSPFTVTFWMKTFSYSASHPTVLICAVFPVTGFVIFTALKNGAEIRYTSWPEIGKSPNIPKTTKAPMDPESSLPGNPPLLALKAEGM